VKLEKRIERMRNSTRAVDPAELHAILIALGFNFRPAKGTIASTFIHGCRSRSA